MKTKVNTHAFLELLLAHLHPVHCWHPGKHPLHRVHEQQRERCYTSFQLKVFLCALFTVRVLDISLKSCCPGQTPFFKCLRQGRSGEKGSLAVLWNFHAHRPDNV